MIKVILFDCDGPIIRHNKYFSQRLEDLGYKINHEKVTEFFKGDFLECEIGKKDLKQLLPKWIGQWGWQGSADDLLKFWFEGEAEVDEKMKEYIGELRSRGIKTYLSTNNEKYRVNYLWNTVGLKSFLDGKLPSGELRYLKPQIEFWQEAYNRIPKIAKDEVLVLDDVESAIYSAREFGFNAEFYTDFQSFKKVMEQKYQIKS